LALFDALRSRFGSDDLALTFYAYREDAPGPRFRALYDATWSAYERWFMREGDAARPSYVTSRRMLREHMPELVPTWEALCELAGGGDGVARLLALWTPPRFIVACSQVALAAPAPFLVRNYDYSPTAFEGVIAGTRYLRPVIGTSDCLWGLLDGVNDAGLAISITFGGRREHGQGFGIALVVRYVLETCATTAEAIATLRRLPVHFSYNVTTIDTAGHAATVFVAPDRPAIARSHAVATNHQGEVDWPEYARATESVERAAWLDALIAERHPSSEELAEAFLVPPLYNRSFSAGFGTLYTAVLVPGEGRVSYRWPGEAWSFSFDAFEEGERTIRLREREAMRFRVPWRAIAK
jgi:predicted choloylglycine hydrolase